MNAVNFQQLPALLLPLVQMVSQSLPPGTPPYVSFGLNAAVNILGAFSQHSTAQAAGLTHRPMAMPAHLPELPPEDRWTPEGMRAWAEQHAG